MTEAEQPFILVLFVQVRILVGQLELQQFKFCGAGKFIKPAHSASVAAGHGGVNHLTEIAVLGRELTLYQFNLNYLLRLANDLDEQDMMTVPFAGANPPVWILGHLALATDYAGQILGLARACPRDWHVKFAPGSKAADLSAPLPSKADLVAAIENGHRRVAEAVPGASPEILDKPHEIAILKSTNLKTNGDVLAHLMCTHAAFHIAQLSACRRHSGQPPIR